MAEHKYQVYSFSVQPWFDLRFDQESVANEAY